MSVESLQDKRIFLIEDNVGNRAIMQTLLEQSGAKISFERWGTDTISRDCVNSLQWILSCLDLNFPRGVTGYDVFDDIRAFPEFDNIPIVAVSASEPAISIPKTKEKVVLQALSVNRLIMITFPRQIISSS